MLTSLRAQLAQPNNPNQVAQQTRCEHLGARIRPGSRKICAGSPASLREEMVPTMPAWPMQLRIAWISRCARDNADTMPSSIAALIFSIQAPENHALPLRPGLHELEERADHTLKRCCAETLINSTGPSGLGRMIRH